MENAIPSFLSKFFYRPIFPVVSSKNRCNSVSAYNGRPVARLGLIKPRLVKSSRVLSDILKALAVSVRVKASLLAGAGIDVEGTGAVVGHDASAKASAVSKDANSFFDNRPA
jgi:hypothetical protein